MRQPRGFEIKGQENKVCLLQKAIYGLHQSGRECSKKFECIVIELGFEKVMQCKCVYKLKSEIVLVVYVDDIIIFAKDENLIKETTNRLKNKLDIKELGKVRHILGVNFEKESDKYYLHQRTYIDRLQMKFKDLPRSRVKLPRKIDTLPARESSRNPVENDIMKKFLYRTLIRCLSSLADRSRPNVSFAVNLMSQFCNCYNYYHWKIVVDTMNYVFETKDYKIDLSTVNEKGLIAFSDANWRSSLTNRHSTSGYILFYNGVPFMWKSSK